MMKKIFFVLVLLVSAAAIISSCRPSQKLGCPNNQGIIH